MVVETWTEKVGKGTMPLGEEKLHKEPEMPH